MRIQTGRSQTYLFVSLLFIILILAAYLHIPIFDRGFNPGSTSDIDAIWIIYSSFQNLNTGEGYERLAGYPPFMLWIYEFARFIATQAATETDASQAVQVLAIARLINAFANIGTVALIALIGKELLNHWVGLIAATIWVASPLLYTEFRTGLTESWQVFFIALSVYSAILTIEKKREWLAVLSTIAGLFAVIAKYPAFPVLGFGVGLIIWFCITMNWRKWGYVLGIQVILIVTCAIWLLFSYGAISAFSYAEGAEVITGELSRYRDWESFVRLFGVLSGQVGLNSGSFIVLCLVGTGLILRQATATKRVFVAFMWIFVLSHTGMVLLYLIEWNISGRYVSTTSVITALLVAIGIERIVSFFLDRLAKANYQVLAKAVTLILIMGFWQGPKIVQEISQLSKLIMPRNELRFAQWTEVALGEGTIHLFDDWTWVYFDLDWGGFLSRVRPWVNERVSEPLLSQSPETWVSKYVYYAEITETERREMLATDEGIDYLSELTLLKTFPVSDGWSGEDIHVYELRDIEPANEILFGEQIELIGYNLSTQQIRAGEQLTVQFFWRAVQQPKDNYQVYLHLVSSSNRDILAQVDNTPATPAYQTSLWVDPQEIISGRVFESRIPEDLPPGEYRLIMGLYELDTFTRLVTQSGDDYVVVSNIEVVD